MKYCEVQCNIMQVHHKRISLHFPALKSKFTVKCRSKWRAECKWIVLCKFSLCTCCCTVDTTMMCFSVYTTECKWIFLCRGQKCLFVFAFSTACDRFIEHLLENGRKKTNVLHFWTSECILSLVQICILRIKQFCEQMSKNGNFPSLFSPGGPSKILQGNTTSASMERVFRTNSTKTIRK